MNLKYEVDYFNDSNFFLLFLKIKNDEWKLTNNLAFNKSKAGVRRLDNMTCSQFLAPALSPLQAVCHKLQAIIRLLKQTKNKQIN